MEKKKKEPGKKKRREAPRTKINQNCMNPASRNRRTEHSTTRRALTALSASSKLPAVGDVRTIVKVSPHPTIS